MAATDTAFVFFWFGLVVPCEAIWTGMSGAESKLKGKVCDPSRMRRRLLLFFFSLFFFSPASN